MAGTPEDDLLAWLEREEELLGFDSVDRSLAEYESARSLFFDELGYDITEGQFEGLKQASVLRYEELPSIGITYERQEQSWGFQNTYRDKISGRFVNKEDVFSLLATLRSL